ncbi:MAG: MFS transporter [Chromatiales bacterium]
MKSLLLRRPVFAWALYDWANSAFATTVMAGFFPIFFKQYWSVGTEATVSTFRLGVANGTASFILAVLAPLLGAIADRGGARLRFLASFTALALVMTGSLYFVERGAWQWAAMLYIGASLGFSGAMIFYDSLLIDVAPRKRLDLVSSFGYSLGYLGGGVLLALNAWMTLDPESFGLADSSAAVRVAFVTVAAWWAIFAIPLFLFVRERSEIRHAGASRAIREGFAQLAGTFREIRRYRPLWLFLLAYWCYIDGVNTFQKMAADYGLSLGIPAESLIMVLLVVQFVGFPAALLFGWLGERISPRAGILIGIATYVSVTIWIVITPNLTSFYAIAVAIGLVQGGVQSLSRSYFGSLIPADRPAEFFGFYNMMGRFASVLGPFLMGATALIAGSSRLSILSLIVLFVVGAGLLALGSHGTPQSKGSPAALT